ncbi:amino acid permease [Mycobacterium sp. 852013-50091_SCH5140682]|uniref:APC family permease n=1 Tax=Mycobacterium sp. 852013-50091_SCH5140682 TaxID=1834109 RepID=UPI0007EA9481|nr:amino acid permease [Mycobacterium sp. 852013-50091_SCH5140682]
MTTDQQAARADSTHLPASLRRLDVFAVLLCALVGVDTLGAVSAYGPQGLLWMALVALVFFVPYGLLTAELGSAFPQEGGPYVWTRMAFGRFAAGINQFFYWISNPVWIGGTLCIVAVVTFNEFFFPLTGMWRWLAAAAFVWGSAFVISASVRFGRWIYLVGAAARIVLLTLFIASVVVYACKNGIQPIHASDFSWTYAGFVAVVPVIVFNFLGFEVPSNAAEEMVNPQKDVPLSVLRGGVTATLLYGIPVVGILLVLPKNQLGTVTGFVDACRAVFTVYGGRIAPDGTAELWGFGRAAAQVAAVGLIIGLFTSGTAWAMGVSRAQAVAFTDGAGPAWLGTFSRNGSPTRVNLLSAAISTIVMAAAMVFANGNAEKYFSAAIGLVVSATAISYILTFSSFMRLRIKYPDTRRPFRVIGGRTGGWVVTILTVGTMLFTVASLLWPGIGVTWFDPSVDSNMLLPSGFDGDRTGYTLSQLIPMGAVLAGAICLYIFGSAGRRSAAPSANTPESTRRCSEVVEEEKSVGAQGA